RLLPGLLAGLPIGLLAGLGVGLFTWLVIGLALGLAGKRLAEHNLDRPNQGVWLTSRNALFLGLLGGLVLVLGYVLDGDPGTGLADCLATSSWLCIHLALCPKMGSLACQVYALESCPLPGLRRGAYPPS